MNYEIRELHLDINGKHTVGFNYMPKSINTKPIILLCHGNYHDGMNAEIMVAIADNFASRGFAVFGFDNLCYNKAWRPRDDVIHSPEEIDLRWTAFAATTHIHDRYPEREIIIIGHSMGAAIALAVGSLMGYINRIIAISPTRISAFISNDNELYSFWKSSSTINAILNIDIIRSIRFDIMLDNYIPFIAKKKTLLLCGSRERYLGYKKWVSTMAASIGDNCDHIVISNADHYFGIEPGKADIAVFTDFFNIVEAWIVY